VCCCRTIVRLTFFIFWIVTAKKIVTYKLGTTATLENYNELLKKEKSPKRTDALQTGSWNHKKKKNWPKQKSFELIPPMWIFQKYYAICCSAISIFCLLNKGRKITSPLMLGSSMISQFKALLTILKTRIWKGVILKVQYAGILQ